jgi:hypothetical protein
MLQMLYLKMVYCSQIWFGRPIQGIQDSLGENSRAPYLHQLHLKIKRTQCKFFPFFLAEYWIQTCNSSSNMYSGGWRLCWNIYGFSWVCPMNYRTELLKICHKCYLSFILPISLCVIFVLFHLMLCKLFHSYMTLASNQVCLSYKIKMNSKLMLN